MTRNKDWKSLVRAEMARTGEGWQKTQQRLRAAKAESAPAGVALDLEASGVSISGAAAALTVEQAPPQPPGPKYDPSRMDWAPSFPDIVSRPQNGAALAASSSGPPGPMRAPDPASWQPRGQDMVPRQRNHAALPAALDSSSAISNSITPMPKGAWQDEGDRLSLRTDRHYAEIIWNGRQTADLYVMRLDDRKRIHRGQEFFTTEAGRQAAAVQLQAAAEAAILRDTVTTASGSTPSLHADAVGTSTVAVSLNDAEEPAPRLPQWGHIHYKDKAANQRGLTSWGSDDPLEAAKQIARMVAKAIQRDAEWALFRVRTVGEPASAPPERLLELVVDPAIGLTTDQQAEVIGATAVSQQPLLIRVWFVGRGQQPPRPDRMVHLMLVGNSASPTLELAREKERRINELRAAGASRCSTTPNGPVFDSYAEAFKASRDGLDLCSNCLPKW